MTKDDVRKAFMDVFSDVYDWLNDPETSTKQLGYVLGAYDMANYMIDVIDKKEDVE